MKTANEEVTHLHVARRDGSTSGVPGARTNPAGSGCGNGAIPDHGETSYTGSGRLAGKKALITGGDSGIGRAVAIAFAREGADVAINYLPEEQKDADEVIALIKAEGRTAVASRVIFAQNPSASRWWPTRWNSWEV